MTRHGQGARWLALAGVISPWLLGVATVLVAAGRPDYSHLHQTLSELGAVGQPGASWMNASGIVPTGALVAASAFSLHTAFGPGRLSAAGATLLALGGALLATTGLTPWQGGMPADLRIAGNWLHLLCAVLGFAGIGLAPLFFGLRARQMPAARSWAAPSLIAALVVLAAAFWPAPGTYAGAFQRVALAAFFLWLMTICAWTWWSWSLLERSGGVTR